MKLDSIKMTAVIPTQQYGNIQPSIEMSECTLEEGRELGLTFIKDLFAKYSEKGALTEKEFSSALVTKYTKKSFNEEGVEIEFEPVSHTYTYKDKKLTGCTDYIKKFYKPFDAPTISSVLESKWGVPQQVIRDLWDANGEVSSDFGSVVHKALEYYQKFKPFGEIISSQQKEDKNYCLPKHPILRQIVEGFLELIKDEVGQVLTEVLISSITHGICGHADRVVILDADKKICRIKDYKVNINSEDTDKSHKVLSPFADLPSTKLSKYQLQMSVYANMLEATGWTVVGLDVFVYEDTWKHFELPVLKVI